MPQPSDGITKTQRSVGDYRVALELGKGTNTTVYLALRGGAHGFERPYALKHLPDPVGRPSLVEIDHPSVCRVIDLLEAEDGQYLAMEYLRGAPLSRILVTLHQHEELATDPRLPRLVARIIAGLAEGLQAAHRRDIIHRNVCLQNLFVLYDGSVRVTDFAPARAKNRRQGRVAYKAPELLERGNSDRRTDIWALGVVTWELLVGRRLFRCSSDPETMDAVLEREIEPPSMHQASVPGALDRIVMRALERDPNARYQSARELSCDLERFLGSSADTVPATDVAEWMSELFPDGQAQADGLVEHARNVAAKAGKLRPEPPAPAEVAEEPEPRRARLAKLGGMLFLCVSMAALGVASVQFISGKPIYPFTAAAAETGLVNIDCPGTTAEVIHRGKLIGKTPISLSLSAGEHELVLRGNGTEMKVTIPVTAGEPSSVSVPFPAPVSRRP